MLTAARATSSSARETSSCSKGSGRSARQNVAMPMITPRARSGTVSIAWIPNATSLRAFSGSWTCQPEKAGMSGSSTDSPVPKPKACGLSGAKWISLPIG